MSFLSPPQALQGFPLLFLPVPPQTGHFIVLNPLHVLQAICLRGWVVFEEIKRWVAPPLA